MYVTWKVDWTPIDNNVWDDADTVTLTSYYDPEIQIESGQGRNSFSFKVTNFNETFSNYFHPNDKIVLSRVINTDTVTTSDIKLVGSVQNVPEERSGTTNLIRVEGFDFSEAVLSAIVFIDARTLTIPEAIQLGLNFLQLNNSRSQVTWHPDNPSLNSSGGAFPVVGEQFFYKPLKDLIEKYSQNTQTGDGNYYYYVDNQNRLVWRQVTNATSSSSFNASTDDYKRFKISKDIKEVKNFIIIKGGVDPEGKAYQQPVADYASISKNGMKFYVLVDFAKVAGTLIKRDTDSAGVSHMRDASFPFTSTWISLVTGDYITASDYDDYLGDLRAHIELFLRLAGREFISQRRYGKLLVELEFEPDGRTWGLGDLVPVTISSLSSVVKNLRVTSIKYTTDSDIFTLTEDIGSV